MVHSANLMGTLYIVATPIGNLEDITLRSLRVLKEVDVVFCEDTRHAAVLFGHFGIETPKESFHAQSSLSKIKKLINLLEEGKNVALITDAGTPSVSDPGAKLVSLVREKLPDAKIVPIPGASALTCALSVAGLKTNEFTFYGFLPHKKGRKKLFEEIRQSKRASIFYESPHRILKALEALAGSKKEITIARELTKVYEEVVSGTAEEFLSYFKDNPDKVKGEFVVMVR